MTSRPLPWLLALWGFATFWNIDKPFHMDDTAYLEIAQWIAAHPLHPMAGEVNWGHDPEPIHHINQPHLYFYLMALVGRLAGWGEVPQHLLQAGFALAAILLFHRLALKVAPACALFVTALLALGPGFVVNQNTMVEIPLLALVIGCYWALIAYAPQRDAHRLLVAGLFAAAAVLVKYTGIVLIPALLLDIALRRNWRQLPLATLPLLALLLWSGFNWLDYGGIHILERPLAEPGQTALLPALLDRAGTWLICLGAVMLPVAFLAADRRWRPAAFAIPLALAAAALWFVAMPDAAEALSLPLRALFGATGLAMLLLAIRADQPLLTWWAASAAGFVIVLAPFMGTRHVLLSLAPLLLLLGHRFGASLSRPWRIGNVALVGALGAMLAAGDGWAAASYRDAAFGLRMVLPTEATVWFSGHWGWQWYARAAGMRQIASSRPEAVPGDYLVRPRMIHQQRLPDGLHLAAEPALVLARPCCVAYLAGTRGSFYQSNLWFPPWAPHRAVFDTIEVYRVVP